MQIAVRLEALGPDAYERILNLDVGDIIGVNGCIYVTQRGQLALAVEECELLTKTLRPPPDKHHGLGDTGTRYRYRELDLLANEESRELFIERAQIVAAIRQWLDERNFVEVETPALQSLAGGAGSRPFITHHNALDRELYLRISSVQEMDWKGRGQFIAVAAQMMRRILIDHARKRHAAKRSGGTRKHPLLKLRQTKREIHEVCG